MRNIIGLIFIIGLLPIHCFGQQVKMAGMINELICEVENCSDTKNGYLKQLSVHLDEQYEVAYLNARTMGNYIPDVVFMELDVKEVLKNSLKSNFEKDLAKSFDALFQTASKKTGGNTTLAYVVLAIKDREVLSESQITSMAKSMIRIVKEIRRQSLASQTVLVGAIPTENEKNISNKYIYEPVYGILNREYADNVIYVDPTSWFVDENGKLRKNLFQEGFSCLSDEGYAVYCDYLKEYINVPSVLSGGGNLNPDLRAPKEAQEKWQDMRVGLSVHWGPSSLGGKEIGWSRGKIIPAATYDQFYKRFNPDKFDAEEWCHLLKRWGMKYISPTAKHHDGFALWFSDYSDYDMENAARKVDILAELRRACDKSGIVLGAYYSNIDWYHPDWYPNEYGGPGPLFEQQKDSPNLDRYFKYMENQVCEMIEKYDLSFVQFDGEWDSTYTHERGSELYRKFHKAKPDVLLNSRIDIGRRAKGKDNHIEMDGKNYAGDFQDRERLVNWGNNVTKWCDHPWQAWVTIDKRQWSYNETPQLMSAKELIVDLIHIIGSNGNYMINLGPRPDGSFEPEQIALMDTLGGWLNNHSEMIYGTRGGPFYPFPGGVSTRKGTKAWILVTDSSMNMLRLPRLLQPVKSVIDYDTKRPIEFQSNTESITFSLPSSSKHEYGIRVIELTFDDPVKMSPRKPVYETDTDRNENFPGWYVQ